MWTSWLRNRSICQDKVKRSGGCQEKQEKEEELEGLAERRQQIFEKFLCN
jgi:hypothetical protein